MQPCVYKWTATVTALFLLRYLNETGAGRLSLPVATVMRTVMKTMKEKAKAMTSKINRKDSAACFRGVGVAVSPPINSPFPLN